MATEANTTDEHNTSMKDPAENLPAPTRQQPKKSAMDPPGAVAIAKPPLNPSSTTRANKPEGDKDVSLPPPPPQVPGSQQSKPAAGGPYKPPSWGVVKAPEASGLSLTVLKNGVDVNTISLDYRTHVLLGRQQGVVDVLLEHPSISRKHAVLQHGPKGSLFLFDIGSTHGCSVNKQKIPSKEFHRLHVGDVIKFGESTRLYALEGPEEMRPTEYESDNLRAKRLEAGRKQLAAKLAKMKADASGEGAGGDSGEYGISWGFDEDAVAEEEEEEGGGVEGVDGEVELPEYLKTEAQKRRRRDTKVGLAEDSVHKKDSKLFEKLQLKLTKVEHLLTENERIAVKEGKQGGLATGQQAQLVRNDKAIANLRLQIEEIEETIRSKNKARDNSKEGENRDSTAGTEDGVAAAGVGDEDDDYYDRTAPVNRVSARSVDGGAVSKKAEIRARRFGVKDKTKKLSVDSVGSVSTAVRGKGMVGSISPVRDLESGSGAQSLEALSRRVEVVSEDLERTEGGLVELEMEEAEEAGEAAGEDAIVADPLDVFMVSNRNKERQQAMLRLMGKRDALREEQAHLRAMVAAARPSMPALKAAPKPASTTTAAVSEGTEANVPGSSPPDKVAVATGNEDCSIGNGDSRDDGLKVKAEVAAVGVQDAAAAAARAAGGPPEKGPMLPPQRSSVMAAPNALLRRPAVPPSAVRALQPIGGTDGDNSCEKGEGGKQGPVPLPTETPKSSGVKRRGTPVGTGMSVLPPPAKRTQQRVKTETSVAVVAPVVESGVSGDSPKRPVKGPAAMPPPPGNPSRNVKPSSGGGGVDRRTSDPAVMSVNNELLEGGDADWVPPKGQAGDGRTALNLKFGY